MRTREKEVFERIEASLRRAELVFTAHAKQYPDYADDARNADRARRALRLLAKWYEEFAALRQALKTVTR